MDGAHEVRYRLDRRSARIAPRLEPNTEMPGSAIVARVTGPVITLPAPAARQIQPELWSQTPMANARSQDALRDQGVDVSLSIITLTGQPPLDRSSRR